MSCFQLLSDSLNDTYSATIQSEEELTLASATLILSGLLQIHARTPHYASYRIRLESFPNNTYSCSTRIMNKHLVPSAAEFASAGFFHTGSGDETVCPACGLGLRDWQVTDQPESCHIAYSTAKTNALETKIGNRSPTPALPCLYLAVRRLLVSEIPLARKSLVPVGPVQSFSNLPGVISRPIVYSTDENGQESHVEYPSLADRLNAIVHMMSASPSPQGWPVENARALGHSDDLIVLALWRLQAEAAVLGLACPPVRSLYLDPHGTTELLRAILRIQEGFDISVKENLEFDLDHLEYDENELLFGDDNENGMTAEDVETAALSRSHCQNRRLTHTSNSRTDSPSSPSLNCNCRTRRISVLPFYKLLKWWSDRWSSDFPELNSNNTKSNKI